MRRTSRTLQANHAPGAEPIRVNLRTIVNNADIRTVNEDGREYLVIPSYTLPDNVVMNGGLYPKAEIDSSYLSLEDTPAPVGHPMANGKYISAYHPKATNAYYAGAYNRNVRRDGNRVYLEKWVDTEFAKNSIKGRELLDAVAKKQPIHTSTGIMLDREPATNGDGYEWIARNMKFDHDAILINETGAATPEQGVGLMVNVSDAVPASDSALKGQTYADKQEELREALCEVFAAGDQWLYVEDFTDTSVVYCVGDEYFTIGYTTDADGKVALVGQPQEVERKTTFTLSSAVNKILTMFRSGVTSKPVNTLNTEALDMTPEELKAALDAQLAALNAANTAALAPLTEQITALQAANTELKAALTANTTAQEAEMRAVVAEHVGGEVVANALSGEALKAAFVKFSPAAPIVGGLPRVNTKNDGFDELPE